MRPLRSEYSIPRYSTIDGFDRVTTTGPTMPAVAVEVRQRSSFSTQSGAHRGIAIEEKHTLRSALQRSSNTGVHAAGVAEVGTGLDDTNAVRPGGVAPERRFAVVVDDDDVVDRSRRLQQRAEPRARVRSGVRKLRTTAASGDMTSVASHWCAADRGRIKAEDSPRAR